MFDSAFGSQQQKIPQQAQEVTLTLNGQVDMCLSCHDDKPDKAHGRRVLPCSACHLGNPLAGTPFEAHKGMAVNPGELRLVDRTCGQEGCHVQETQWVKNTLMATNRGIISTLRYYWGETTDHDEKITVEMLRKKHERTRATDYFSKLCGTCHLWLEKRSLSGFLGEKGGGCTACHYSKEQAGNDDSSHPAITRKIPLKNCVRCHNRSGRIGLTYQGLYENEGYGTPFDEGDTSSLQLPDGRFLQRLLPDVHFEKGLVCVDCHGKKELMGDGKQKAHLYQQVEIECQDCHLGEDRLRTFLNESKNKKNKFPKFTNLIEKDDKIYLKGKIDGRLHPLDRLSTRYCRERFHERLTCQACHSSWVPQCFGCHVRMDKSKMQLDKLTLKETYGKWEEFKSYMRYERPILGVNKEADGKERIVVLVPG